MNISSVLKRYVPIFKCASVLALSCAFVPTAGVADSLDEPTTFEIDAQDLDTALIAFSEQARIQLVVQGKLVAGLESDGLQGEYTPRTALTTLLDNKSLTYTAIDGSSVAVVAKEVSSDLGNVRTAPMPVLMAQNPRAATESSVSQTNRAPNEDDEREPPRLEEIVVTGSRIRGAQSASPVITISRQEIDIAGFATTEDIVENLPQNFGVGATSDSQNNRSSLLAVGGDVKDLTGGGVSVNLRGLGGSSTLVLLNGRRMSPSGSEARFTDISSIPVTAIERVEILTDGASAIYGSDAIGGVINFVMRDDYEGAETRLRYSSDSRGDSSNTQFGQSFGKAWGSGSVLFSYEYFEREALASADRKYTASNDLTAFGGTDWRQLGGLPANIVAGGQSFAIPAGQDGTSLTPADFDPNAPLNRFNERSFFDTIPDQERHSAFMHLAQTVGPVDVFGLARFASSDTQSRTIFPGTINLNVPGDDPTTPGAEGNPFFVDPTDTGLTSVRIGNYRPESIIGPRITIGEVESSGATLGARFGFSENWSAELVGNWSKEEATGSFANQLDRAALTAAVNQKDPALAFNPFGDGSGISPAVLESVVIRRVSDNMSENELWSISLNVDGDAFEVAGGPAKIATGIDFREESLLTRSRVTDDTDRSRDIAAAYAELFLPFVSDANSRPGLQRLEISVASRYEDYSDFGDSINPKLGILWSPTESLALRGTVGTSYRAPALADLNDSTATSFLYFAAGAFNGLIPDDLLVLNGNNPGLGPEEAITWTAGFQWRPERVDGLSLDVTYFNVDFDDRIELPTQNSLGALADPRLASIVTFDPTRDQIAVFVNDPNYLPNQLGFGDSAENLLSGASPLAAIIDNRKTNLSQSVVTGAELQLSYTMQTDVGSFSVALNGSYMFDFKRRLVRDEPLVDEVDTIGRPVDLRARGNVSWSRNNWVVAGFVNYTDGYTDNVSDPAQAVSSLTTVDATVAYTFGTGMGVLNGMRMLLSAQNLLDKDPPFVDTFGGLAYDAANANPLGRVVSLQITKDW